MNRKNKAQILKELMENPSSKEMLETTDTLGGQLKSGWKKCSI